MMTYKVGKLEQTDLAFGSLPDFLSSAAHVGLQVSTCT